MANTRIQIKRSVNTKAIPSLYTGELCYTMNASGGSTANEGLIYVGSPSTNTPIPIGGVLTFGNLTANQVLSTNSTSGLDKLYTTTLNVAVIVVPTQGNGQAGQILTSNGSSNIYWSSAGGGGTVTQITMGAGLTSTQSPLTGSGTMSVNLASATPGLQEVSGGLAVLVANGLNVTAAGINVLGNNGILANSTGTWANLAASPGLTFVSGGLAVSPGSSIAVGATTTVNLAATSGLTTAGPGLAVSAGPGAVINSSGVCANLGPCMAFTAGAIYDPGTIQLLYGGL